MTAEIAVLNREALALAADSAITSEHEGGQKIFISANKIFALSKYAPVAVMIYGNPQLMRVPWENVWKIRGMPLGEEQDREIADLERDSGMNYDFITDNDWDAYQRAEQENRDFGAFYDLVIEPRLGDTDA